MGFVSEVLKNVEGLYWYYSIGIFIFIVLFVIIAYKTLRTPKEVMEEYKNAILDDDNGTEVS